MAKRNIVFMVVAAIVLQMAMAGQVYAWVGCPVDVRLAPWCEDTFICKAQGGMQYYPSLCWFWFDFGGIGLESCQDYTLVCGTFDDLIYLGCGTTNRWGQIHIRECVDTGDLCNVRVALVPSEDLMCFGDRLCIPMWKFHPCRYLCGKTCINYDDTNGVNQDNTDD